MGGDSNSDSIMCESFHSFLLISMQKSKLMQWAKGQDGHSTLEHCMVNFPETYEKTISQYNVRTVYTFGLVCAARVCLLHNCSSRADDPDTHENAELITSEEWPLQVVWCASGSS